MPATVAPIPEGFSTVSVHMVVPNCVEALDFYAKAFGAKKLGRLPGPDGKGTLHASMRLGDSTIMMSDENAQWGVKSPRSLGATPVTLHVYVENADELFERARNAGCTETMPIQDMFWGDRYGKLRDPFGHEWSIATHQEDIRPEEMAHRAKEAMSAMCGKAELAGSKK